MKQVSAVAALLTMVLCYPVAAAQQPAVNAPRAVASPISATQVPVQTAATENPAMLAQPPLQITHHGTSPIPAGRLYRALKTQFAGGQLGPWQVVSSDPRTRTLVVRRNYIDIDNWSQWAYCKVGPLDMLDSLRDGYVTMAIKLEPARGVTYTSTTADFEGIYGLTSTGKVVPCISRGVLEDNVLATIAAENPPPEPHRLAKHVTIRSRRHHRHHPTHAVG
jgi:hypothetical protein